jgi:hypothetical protein
MSAPLPTDEQEQRAKWDLLLLDIEARTEHLRQASGIDRDLKLARLRQMTTLEGWKLVFAGMSASAACFIAGAAVGGVLVHLGGLK